jgi:hypothetical protein
MKYERTLKATQLHLGFLSEIAIRNRSHIGCDWGQNWGHILVFQT